MAPLPWLAMQLRSLGMQQVPDFNWNQGISVALLSALAFWFFRAWGPVLVDEFKKGREERRQRQKRDEDRATEQQKVTTELATEMTRTMEKIAGQHEEAAKRDSVQAEVLRSIHELQIRHSQLLDAHGDEIHSFRGEIATAFDAIGKKLDAMKDPAEQRPRKRGTD